LLGYTVENQLFESEGNEGRAGDSRTAREIRIQTLRYLRGWAYQAHIPPKHTQQLGQLIKLPAAQKKAYRSEAQVARGDRMMRVVPDVDHGSELQHGEGPTVTPHPLLQKKNGAARCQPHRQGDGQQNRKQQRQRQ